MTSEEDKWNDVEACIDEISWFVSRKKNLAEEVDEEIRYGGKTWADVLARDVQDLRAAIRRARTKEDER